MDLLDIDAPYEEVYVQLARYVALIFYGARASSLPVAVPTRSQMAINIRTAAAVNTKVPYELLVEAHEVFE
mgnify:CR=1 FL=1